MHHLVGESKWAHSCFRDASTALPGIADGKPYAAIFQPSTVTLVVVLETPGGVKLADQRQLSSLMFTCVFCLLKGERPRYVGDSACERRKDLWKTSRKLESRGLLSFKYWHTFVQNGITGISHIFLTAVEVSRTETANIFPLMNFFIMSHQQILLSCQPTISPTLTLQLLKVSLLLHTADVQCHYKLMVK